MNKKIYKLFNNELFDNNTENTKGAPAYKSLLNPIADVFYLNSRFANQGSYKVVNSDNLTGNITDFLEKYNVLINKNPVAAVALFLMNLDIKHGKGERTSSLLMARELAKSKKTREMLNESLPAVLALSGWRMIFGLYQLTSQSDLKDNDYKNTPALDSKNLFALTTNALIANNDALIYKWIWNPTSLDVIKRYGLNRFLHDINSLGVRFTKRDYAKWRVFNRRESNLNLIETNLTNRTYDNIEIAKLPKRAQKLHLELLQEKLPEQYNNFISNLDAQTKTVFTVNVPEAYHGFVNANDAKQKRYYANLFFNAVKELNMKRHLIGVIDVSESMSSHVDGSGVTNMDVSISLGLALALKNTGKFENAVFTFSNDANLVKLPELDKMAGADETDKQVSWLDKSIKLVKKDIFYGTTNLSAIFKLLIKVGKEDATALPDGLVILSDGEFDAHHGKAAIADAQSHFKKANLRIPTIVSWNLNSNYTRQALPFTADDGIYLISGYNINLFNIFTKLDFKNPDLDNIEIIKSALTPYVDLIGENANLLDFNKTKFVDYYSNVLTNLNKVNEKKVVKKGEKKTKKSKTKSKTNHKRHLK